MQNQERYDFDDLEREARMMELAKNVAAIKDVARHIDYRLESEGPSPTRRTADLLAALLEQNKDLLAKQNKTNDLLTRINLHAMCCFGVLFIIAWRIW